MIRRASRGHRWATLLVTSLLAACGGESDTSDDSAEPGSGDTPPTESASDRWPREWARFEDEVLVLVNKARASGATCGFFGQSPAPPLRMEAALRSAARKHSRDMAEGDFLSHTGSDGSSPWDRAESARYTGFPNAENVAAGQPTPEDVVDAWLGSSGHCRNLMSADSNEIGIGYAASKDGDFGHYWTQSFGQR